jgi:hypothetical protein
MIKKVRKLPRCRKQAGSHLLIVSSYENLLTPFVPKHIADPSAGEIAKNLLR